MSFEEAVRAAPAPVDCACRSGLQALKRVDRSRITCADPRRLTGSIDLDSALAGVVGHSNAPRWDYGIGYRPNRSEERAVWVEVHPASTSNVREVTEKLRWLRTWLRSEAPRLNSLTTSAARAPVFVWIATGGVRIPRNSPQARRLSATGLVGPHRVLHLP